MNERRTIFSSLYAPPSARRDFRSFKKVGDMANPSVKGPIGSSQQVVKVVISGELLRAIRPNLTDFKTLIELFYNLLFILERIDITCPTIH